jgi:BirA family biotin operon repressor/biotin-[acetyl-CoA-carboxylase] ligase
LLVRDSVNRNEKFSLSPSEGERVGVRGFALIFFIGLSGQIWAMFMTPHKLPHDVHLAGKAETHPIDRWTLFKYDVVTSTNLVATSLPVWNAVCANTQTDGRGRFQREWVSDQGGLWLSAVVPISPVSGAAKTLPLVVGLVLCEVLSELGVRQPRLRWPNDVLVKDRKLAGILLDQFSPGVAVVGIGLNVFNHPEAYDPSLGTQAIRLADLVAQPPKLSELIPIILQHLRKIVLETEDAGFRSVLSRLNTFWMGPRRVLLDLDGQIVRGVFTGVDEEGRLILANDSYGTISYEAHQVRHLQET